MRLFSIFLFSIMYLAAVPLSAFAASTPGTCWIKLKLNKNSNYESVAANYVNSTTGDSMTANASQRRLQQKVNLACGNYNIAATGVMKSSGTAQARALATPVGKCPLSAGAQNLGTLTVTFPDDFNCR